MTKRIFLAGASGAIGRPLTAMLVAAGHQVTGISRSAGGVGRITSAGAAAAIADVFDARALTAAMQASRPDVVIHMVTDLTTAPGAPVTDAQLARNAHVREVGTRNLIEAAGAAGAHRLIAQSIAWLYMPGPEPHPEEDPIVPDGPGPIERNRLAVIDLERTVTNDPRFDGIVLRYGRLYGPGTWTPTPDEPPTVHVEAAARAAFLAVDRGEPGIYYIADDAGPVTNTKARRLLGWEPS